MKHWKESAAIFARLDALLSRGQTGELVTLVRVEGSSYRRTGARLLFEPSGAMMGNVSGGCLESDLRAHAERIRNEGGHPCIITYDTSDESLWGLGLGCNGRVDLLLQTVGPAHSQAVAWMRAALEADTEFEICVNADGTLTDSWSTQTLLVDHFSPPPTLLICGAGEDARPFCRMAADVGFRVEVTDARATYCTSERFPEARHLHLGRPETVSIPSLGKIACAVVMTHHLDRDRAWMRRLLSTGNHLRYLGLLGPKPRRDQILRGLLGDEDCELDSRIHAPAGLDLGGEGPEIIALAIVTEMLALINQRSARSLRERPGSIHGDEREHEYAGANCSVA